MEAGPRLVLEPLHSTATGQCHFYLGWKIDIASFTLIK